MSGKKKQRNGFFYFMLDMKEELRRQGRNVPMAQMSALAGPRWSVSKTVHPLSGLFDLFATFRSQQLPEPQKAEYNLRAKHEKRMGYGFNETSIVSRPGRMDCMGELLSVIKERKTKPNKI